MSDSSNAFMSSASGGVMRPKWAYLAAAALCALLGVGAIGTAVMGGVWSPIAVALLHSVLFGSMAFRYATTSTRKATFTSGTLKVDAKRALWLDQRQLAHRDDLLQGFVVPRASSADDAGSSSYTLVRFERRGRLTPPLFVRVQDEEEGAELLRALGFDAEHVAAEMKVASSLLSMSIFKQLLLMLAPMLLVFLPILMTVGLIFRHNASPAILGLVGLLMTYSFTLAFAPTTVRIGTDGIFTRWLGREHFYPFSTIVRATVYDEYIGTKRQHGVKLELRTGQIVRIATGQTDIGKGDAGQLWQRIHEALEARNAGAVAVHSADVLVRGHRTLIEWVRELRRIGSGATGHRTAAVPIDVLLSVVEDSAAPEADRASAAVAAVSSTETEQQSDATRRIRIAAEATASPKLRVALTRIAEVASEDPKANEIDDGFASTLEALSNENEKAHHSGHDGS